MEADFVGVQLLSLKIIKEKKNFEYKIDPQSDDFLLFFGFFGTFNLNYVCD